MLSLSDRLQIMDKKLNEQQDLVTIEIELCEEDIDKITKMSQEFSCSINAIILYSLEETFGVDINILKYLTNEQILSICDDTILMDYKNNKKFILKSIEN